MADAKKDAKPASTEDKSINDLLKEYAQDVKQDRDLDDFLKNDEEDVFESEDMDAEESEQAVAADAPAKKSGGMLAGIFLLLAVSVAGAGAYWYINRNGDEGMTQIMGGFKGEPSADNADAMTPPAAEPEVAASAEQPSLPAPESTDIAVTGTPDAATTDATAADATTQGMPDQPIPIANETTEVVPNDVALADATAPATEAAPEALPAPVSATPEATTPEATAPETTKAAPAAAPKTSDAAKAVDAWASSVATNDNAKLPEKAVEEVKAKPPVAAKEKKAEKVATAQVDTSVADAPKAEAPKKAAKAAPSPYDAALPPPYLAIQKGETPATAAATAAGKMAPVVEGTPAKAGQYEVNGNLADVTSATGGYRDIVTQGGGKIEVDGQDTAFIGASDKAGMAPDLISSKTPAAAPAARVVALTSPSATPAAAPAMMATSMPATSVGTVNAVPPMAMPAPEKSLTQMPHLAITGGKSLPLSSDDDNAIDEGAPKAVEGTKPGRLTIPLAPAQLQAQSAQKASTQPGAPAARVAAANANANLAEAAKVATPAAPVMATPTPTPAPMAAATQTGDAKTALAQAVSLEKAGNLNAALAQYQRALELDAVYADGKSIDRAAVYDRIGAIRAAGAK